MPKGPPADDDIGCSSSSSSSSTTQPPPKKKKPKNSKKSASPTPPTPGVIYISRLPPKLTPSRLRSLLSDHGLVKRIYLEAEDKSARSRRLKQTNGKKGNSGKRYTEGWIEFEDKNIAKRVGFGLNNTPIEEASKGKNIRNGFGEDLWSVKYLKGFRWEDLTEKIAYERRVREGRLRVEVEMGRREEKEFTKRIEEGGKFEKMVERKNGDIGGVGDKDKGFKRKFRQNEPIKDKVKGKAGKRNKIDTSVLGMVAR